MVVLRVLLNDEPQVALAKHHDPVEAAVLPSESGGTSSRVFVGSALATRATPIRMNDTPPNVSGSVGLTRTKVRASGSRIDTTASQRLGPRGGGRGLSFPFDRGTPLCEDEQSRAFSGSGVLAGADGFDRGLARHAVGDSDDETG
ncbi:MAG: hypothetical protein PVJ73_11320 [Acidobacteriota bacterium]|jgi:hypothetical protein